MSLGHLKQDGSIWEFGLIYGSGEYETLSFGSSDEENRTINESTTKGLTLTYLHPMKENGSVKLSMGPRFAYSEESDTITNKYSSESIETIEYVTTQKQRHGMLGLIFQADYAIDAQLSFGIRYSLNYRRTLKTYSSESNLSGSFGEGDAADTLVYTAFDGAHITFRY
ncbi:hypothetical protein [Pseudobacteriovorax antillogorgiicola]|uniref:Uncharacterized protein n=1 Tax=Pseudobacteriovorax antillogorgiicola TaxID=1513793 RepID=A0A1Y6CD90_9BACT|nr:hypothetical protein [Pseudobacteriovorax antillogorgiicola]TCS47903.1 hypothetical protein EDD56_11914 [Pseudobacteriovorax antillogorgiicola]SMF57803.1 hypothetical protein SAMN06296036_11915 [Pseudobacteriovorax antillogorgiicola]